MEPSSQVQNSLSAFARLLEEAAEAQKRWIQLAAQLGA